MPNKKVEMSFPPMIFAFLLDTFALIMPVDATQPQQTNKTTKKKQKPTNDQCTNSTQKISQQFNTQTQPRHNQERPTFVKTNVHQPRRKQDNAHSYRHKHGSKIFILVGQVRDDALRRHNVNVLWEEKEK